MKNDLNTIAFGFIIDNNMLDLVPFNSCKAGMYAIEISYVLKNQEEDNVGNIYICNNGEVVCNILDSDYKEKVLYDYSIITHEKIDGNDDYYFSDTLDETKWNNAKTFIKKNNIPIIFHEDMCLDIEEEEKQLVKDKNEYYRVLRR